MGMSPFNNIYVDCDELKRFMKDGIPINKSLQGIMIELRKDLHLGDYDFPFFSHARAAL
jgi:hypothetical protein